MGDGRLGVLAQVRELKERLAPPVSTGAAAVAPVSLTVNINAPGADREGLREVKAEIRELRGDLNHVNRSVEPRAIRAWIEHRRRGGFR